MYKLLGRLCVCCGNLGDGGHFGKNPVTDKGSHVCRAYRGMHTQV